MIAIHSLPRVTIVTPSLNQGRFLEFTLRSVLRQDYPNLEVIVMDGGSSDESVAILERYASQLSFWKSARDQGQVAAINAGFSRATGEILAWLNSDDLLLPGAIRHVIDAYLLHPHAAAWVGGCHRITGNGRRLNTIFPRGLSHAALLDWGKNYFYQPACFFTASAFREAGPLADEYQYAFDVDFWLRLSKCGAFQPVPHVLAAATIHPEAKTVAHRAAMHAEIHKILVDQGGHAAAARYQGRLTGKGSMFIRRLNRIAFLIKKLAERSVDIRV